MAHPRSEHALVIEKLPALIPDAKLILEIGCNDGRDSVRFMQTFPGLILHCFEPDPRPIGRLWDRVKPVIVETKARFYLHPTAVGAADGITEFRTSHGTPPDGSWPDVPDWDLSGSIHEPTGHRKMSPWITFQNTKVLLSRLDTWFEARETRRTFTGPDEIRLGEMWPMVDFVWADVQGAEHDLIWGGEHTLENHVKFFYTEYYDTAMYAGQRNLSQLTEMLKPLGFELLGTFHDNALFYNTKLVPEKPDITKVL